MKNLFMKKEREKEQERTIKIDKKKLKIKIAALISRHKTLTRLSKNGAVAAQAKQKESHKMLLAPINNQCENEKAKHPTFSVSEPSFPSHLIKDKKSKYPIFSSHVLRSMVSSASWYVRLRGEKGGTLQSGM